MTWSIVFLLCHTVMATSFVTGSMSFDVLNEKEHTVSLTTCWLNNDTLQIPEFVEWKEQRFCVVSIASYAFKDCKMLKVLLIPKSCESISISALNHCYRLENIYVEQGNATYCDVDGVLFSKDMNTLYDYPCGKENTRYKVPDGVVCIADHAFTHSENLQEVDLPQSLTKIGNAAFVGCHSMASVTLPAQITSLGKFAFYDCNKLMTVIIMGNLTLRSEDHTFSYYTYKYGKVIINGPSTAQTTEKYKKIGFSTIEYLNTQQ